MCSIQLLCPHLQTGTAYREPPSNLRPCTQWHCSHLALRSSVLKIYFKQPISFNRSTQDHDPANNLHFNHCHALLNSKDSFCTLNWPTHFYCRCTCTCWPYAICVSMQCATMPANHSLIVKHFSVCLRIQDFNTILCHLNKLMLRHHFKGLIKWICLF